MDTPNFVAVGTNGTLKAVDHRQADDAGLQLMFCNTYHLLLQPGPDTIAAAGGLHKCVAYYPCGGDVLKREPLDHTGEPASQTDATSLCWPHNASSAPRSIRHRRYSALISLAMHAMVRIRCASAPLCRDTSAMRGKETDALRRRTSKRMNGA